MNQTQEVFISRLVIRSFHYSFTNHKSNWKMRNAKLRVDIKVILHECDVDGDRFDLDSLSLSYFLFAKIM